MNIRSLRKSYDGLTMLQRLALADNALGRDDDSEALAIKGASPRIAYTQTDFAELLGQINDIRMCNLVIRLGYVISFDLTLQRQLEKLIDKSSSEAIAKIDNQLRLAAYLYVRATDSWLIINRELGLRPNFDEQIGQYLFAVELLEAKDVLLRSMAFSEEEAREYVRERTGIDQFRTIEAEVEEYRQHLKLDKR